MTTVRSLSELGTAIQAGLARIDAGLKAAETSRPTLGIGSPPNFATPDGCFEDRLQVLQAISEVNVLLYGPAAYIFNQASLLPLRLSIFRVLTEFRIPHKLELDEEITYAELAARCGLPEDDARRLIRAAITQYIFEEPRTDSVRHNAVSLAIRDSPELTAWIELMTTVAEGSHQLVNSLKQYPGSQDPSQAGYAVLHGESFFGTLEKDPKKAQWFADAMTMQSRVPSLAVTRTAESVGWTGDWPKRIVDVGGSNGTLAQELLRRYPIATAVVQDLPDVVAGARVPTDLEGRLTFEEYDFFTEQPVAGADVYIFRTIFHDWPDELAARILKNQIPALKSGARILINDTCGLPPGPSTQMRDQHNRAFDVIMKSNFNGRERGRESWEALLAAADERFEIVAITTPPGSDMSIIEVGWNA